MTRDMMMPYNLLYSILPQVWLLHGAGLGQWKDSVATDCLSFGCLWLSRA